MAPLLVLGSLAAGTARARDARVEAAASPRAKISVLIIEDPSTDWGRRVRGQLSDLPASASIEAAPTLARGSVSEHAQPAAMAEARAAKASRLALTAWLATGSDPTSNEGDATFIAIWFAGAPKPYTRRIAAGWETLGAGDRSAALELAALSVRSAVRSLLLDQTAEHAPPMPAPANAPSAAAAVASSAVASPAMASSAVESAAPESAVPGEQPRAPTVPEELSAARADAPRETSEAEAEPSADTAFPFRLGLELGAAWQFYGRTALGAPGMRAGVQLQSGAWGLELIGQYGWPVSARIEPASFELQRHAALAELSFVAAEVDTWRFCPLLRAGLTWLRRDGTRADDGDIPLQASRAQGYRSPFLGMGAIAEQRLSAALALSLRGVLNVETAIPTFTLVDTSGARVSSGSPWSVQPSMEIGIHWRW